MKHCLFAIIALAFFTPSQTSAQSDQVDAMVREYMEGISAGVYDNDRFFELMTRISEEPDATNAVIQSILRESAKGNSPAHKRAMEDLKALDIPYDLLSLTKGDPAASSFLRDLYESVEYIVEYDSILLHHLIMKLWSTDRNLMLDYVQNPTWSVRYASVSALKRTKGVAARCYMRVLMLDDDERVREFATKEYENIAW